MNNKNFFIVIAILAAVSAVALVSYLPTHIDVTSKTKVSNFPITVGDWKGTDIPVEDKVYEILETKNLFIREYKNSEGEAIYFYVVYSEDNRKVSHPPEVCLLGSGVSVVAKAPLQLTDTVKANKLIVKKGDYAQLVAYWYKAGKLSTDKYLKQQLKVVLDRTFGKRTAGALIRISTDIKENNQEAALNLIRSFCNQIEPLLAQYVP